MKKYISRYIILLLIVLGGFSSCKKNETYKEAKSPEELLTAKRWKTLKVITFTNDGGQQIDHQVNLQMEFKPDGSCFLYEENNSLAEGNWQFKDNNGKILEVSFFFNQSSELNLVSGNLNIRTLNEQYFTFDVVVPDINNNFQTKIFYFHH